MQHHRMPDAPIPVTIVGGYLGAGKTTLVNHLLEHSGDRRIAVIVNDFGQVSRGDRAEGTACRVIRLSRGCVCCRAATEFVMALAEVRSLYPRPDHLVIEASGPCDLTSVADYARLHGLRMDATVVVADAESVRSRAGDPRGGPRVCRQLLAADLIILNKIELLGQRERTSLRDWLGEQFPRPRVVEASYGRVPGLLVMGRGPQGRPKESGERLVEADQEFMAWSWSRALALDPGAFRWWVACLPEGVLRGTGLLHFSDDPGRRHRFDLVGSRWSLQPGGEWLDETPRSDLALVGHAGALDPGLLDMRIAACVAGEPAPAAPLAGRISSRPASVPVNPRRGESAASAVMQLVP